MGCIAVYWVTPIVYTAISSSIVALLHAVAMWQQNAKYTPTSYLACGVKEDIQILLYIYEHLHLNWFKLWHMIDIGANWDVRQCICVYVDVCNCV